MVTEFDNLEDYETFIKTTIKSWSQNQRIALAAAMAERWFYAYQIFSTSENWGNPTILRQGLDAVWNTLDGKSPTVNWSSLSDQIHQNTPHMDDFDANEALCVCIIIQYAIKCCTRKEDQEAAVMAALSGLEAVQSELLIVDKVPSRLWKQAVVHREIKKQLSLIEQLNLMKDTEHIQQALLPFLKNEQMLGELQQKAEKGPIGLTNHQAYERYHKVIQLDHKSAARGLDPKKNPQFATMLYLSAWMSRYSRRKQILSGEYGVLIDQIAVNFVLANNREKDLAETGIATWDANSRSMIERCYQNKLNRLDADTPQSPHAYGPSLRRLWVEAKQQGLSDNEAWEQIQTWAHHQPDIRKQKNQEKSTSHKIKIYIEKDIQWKTTNNPEIPWQADLDNQFLQIQINNFPDDMMYSLMINKEHIGKFHNWPKTWIRK